MTINAQKKDSMEWAIMWAYFSSTKKMWHHTPLPKLRTESSIKWKLHCIVIYHTLTYRNKWMTHIRYTRERSSDWAKKALNTEAYADRSKQWIWNAVSPASVTTGTRSRESIITSMLFLLVHSYMHNCGRHTSCLKSAHFWSFERYQKF